MEILILKLGASGDVVRTTPLLRRFNTRVTWLTEGKNLSLVQGIHNDLRSFSWEQRQQVLDRKYQLIVNLEDTLQVAEFLKTVRYDELFGAYVDGASSLRYTDSARRWFDLSLISSYGCSEADRLKLFNRDTYQALIFEGLGLRFKGERYLLPRPTGTALAGDIAIAEQAGAVWPMKNWAYYAELKELLECEGLTVNVIPKRASLLEHLADVGNHRCLVSGDSLPMHLALGTGTPCVTVFNCTSPWEIYDYGIQTKLISPLLEEFFYKRGYDHRATTAISLHAVFEAVMQTLKQAPTEYSVSRSPSE
jgi:heptosyltransferase II